MRFCRIEYVSAPKRPRVSICVPTYNGASYIRDCLKSILAQSCSDFELLIVDDASTDSTVELIRRALGPDPRVRLISNPRRLGLVGNWNRCVELARGEWIKFVFQDDVLKPTCLSKMLAEARPGVELVVCRRSFRYEPGTPVRVLRLYRNHLAEHTLAQRFPRRKRISPAAFAHMLLRKPVYNCIGEPTATLIRSSAFTRYGRFNPHIISLCDWEFLARVAVNTGLRYTDESLAVFRVHSGAESSVNRDSRAFQMEVLDELVIRHELAHSSAFAPVRTAARLEPSRPDLKRALVAAARVARVRSAQYPGDPGRALRALLEHYPRLSAALRLKPNALDLTVLPPIGFGSRQRAVAVNLLKKHLRSPRNLNAR